MYRILVEAPQMVGMYSLDDLQESKADLEAECFETIKDIAGKAVFLDISTTPHLLIAGAIAHECDPAAIRAPGG